MALGRDLMGENLLLNSHKLSMNQSSVKTAKIHSKEKKSFIFYMDMCLLPAVAHKREAHNGTGGPL